MAKKVMRTIYFSPELDERISTMMSIQGHKRSLLIEHILMKYIVAQEKRDLKAAMESDLRLPKN